jgi:hypothetical protein
MKHPVRRALAAFAGPALVLLALWLLPGGLELNVLPVRSNKPLLVLPMEPGERFTLHYFHSVNHLPIWEVHSVDSRGAIYVEEERFVSFNAGMGHWPGHGRPIQRDGLQVLADIHMPIGRFVLRVGSPGVDHAIIWRGKRFNLTRMAPGQAVLIAARPVSLLERIYTWAFPRNRQPRSGSER